MHVHDILGLTQSWWLSETGTCRDRFRPRTLQFLCISGKASLPYTLGLPREPPWRAHSRSQASGWNPLQPLRSSNLGQPGRFQELVSHFPCSRTIRGSQPRQSGVCDILHRAAFPISQEDQLRVHSSMGRLFSGIWFGGSLFGYTLFGCSILGGSTVHQCSSEQMSQTGAYSSCLSWRRKHAARKPRGCPV